MRIGIEKMKLAHKKKVAIKVFNPDRSNKTGKFPLLCLPVSESCSSAVVVEEGMTSGMVCHLLVVKNHFDESPNWVLVEQLGDVSLGRLAGVPITAWTGFLLFFLRTRAGGS